jgi:hypothetical protein
MNCACLYMDVLYIRETLKIILGRLDNCKLIFRMYMTFTAEKDELQAFLILVLEGDQWK